jgi:hypothetical protein
MVDAQGFPFVRWGKPQPKNLTRVLRYKIERFRRMTLIRGDLEAFWLPLAVHEDSWDRLMAEHHGLQEEEGSGKYSGPMQLELRTIKDYFKNVRRENTALALRMQRVIDKEAELAAKEKEERRAATEMERGGE